MKFILALNYNIDLEDWNINCINKVAKTFDKVFKGIHLQL